MSKYGFSILFMGFELWASFAAFFWLNRWFPHWLSVAVIGLLYVSTILAIVNRNTPPENKVTWLLIAVIPVFGSLLYLMFGERRLSKKEMIQLKNMESMKFREDNSHQLRKELNALVAITASRTGRPHGSIHTEARQKCGGPPTAMCSAEQLRERINYLRRW